MSSHYVKKILSDYCVLDTETTGLSPYVDEVIEIGILKVREDEVVDKYVQLIDPGVEIDPYVSSLTGITNNMVAGEPTIFEVEDEVLSFIGDDVIVGHNVSFDLRFLNTAFNNEVDNEYMDTAQFARKVFPNLPHYRLSDLTEYFELSTNTHRTISDCSATKELYDLIKFTMESKGLKIEDLWQKSKSKGGKGIDISSINPTVIHLNENSLFYGKHVVFTGKLEKMIRKDAMQIIVNLGGILDKGVNSKTNYLILGNNDYNFSLNGEKSSKHKKAEKLKAAGQDIEILDENTFYDIIKEESYY